MIDTDKYEGHTRGPWVWNDDWCSALIGLPNKDADIYDEDAQTVIGVNTKHTPICGSFYTDEHDVRQEAFPEERLRNDALRAEDALLIADAPLLLAEVKRIQQDTLKVVSEWFDSDENEWRKLEQALGLPLTPLSWEGEEE
tara:strand:+ start:60 stop:482 length:423 start_codon:yes stop_codon:yes gene_type:complete